MIICLIYLSVAACMQNIDKYKKIVNNMANAPSKHTTKIGDYPADLLKFTARVKPCDNYEEAVKCIKEKKPVLGEPVVVPYKFTHEDGTTTIELAFGIGSLEVDRPYIKSSLNNEVLNDAVIKKIDPETGEPIYTTLEEILDDLVTENELEAKVDTKISEALKDPAIYDKIVNEVLESPKIDEKISERLRWRPLSELIDKI